MRDVVGVSIGADVVRAVELQFARGGRGTVRRSGEIPLPAHVVDGGQITDNAALAATLRQLWNLAGFDTRRVRMAVAGQLAVVRRTELPSLPADKLRRAASLDLSELLPFSIDDAAFDIGQIETFTRDSERWSRNIVVAVPEAHLDDLETAAREAGLRLVGTDLGSEALTRGVRIGSHEDGDTRSADTRSGDTAHDNRERTDEPVAVIECDDAETNVIVRDRSGILFARSLDVGVGTTAISVADELESALAQLGATNRAEGDSDSTSAVGVSTVIEGVRRSINYYTTEIDRRPVASMTLVGCRARVPGLANGFAESLAIPVELGEPTIPWPTGLELDGYEQALGVALRPPASLRHFRMISEQQLERRARRSESLLGAALLATLLVALIATTIRLSEQSSAAADDLIAAQAADAQFSSRRGELTDVAQAIAAWESARGDIDTLTDQQLRHVVVIQELAEAMPDESRIVSIRLSRNDRRSRPPGYSGATPPGLVTITGITPDLDGVGRWIESVNATSTMTGLWLQQSTFGPVGADGSQAALFTVEGAITAAARPPEAER